MDFKSRYNSLPVSTKRLLGIGMILALVVALPLFVWSIVTQRFLINKRAATGEPGVCVAQNKVITVTPSSDFNGTCHSIQTAIDAVDGDGYTVQIEPGTYNVSSTINVDGKSNLKITGNSQAGSGAARIVFSIETGGWGFKVTSSSGSIQWLTASGSTPNGLLSIQNSSKFDVGYANLNATSSHTMDIHNSNEISVYDTEIQSSAGAIEVNGSTNIRITNNKIHNSDNAIFINNSNIVFLLANLIYNNRQSGLKLNGIRNIGIHHNTFVNNAKDGSNFPTIFATGSIQEVKFMNNIVSRGLGAGLKTDIGITFMAFNYNDIYGNTPNYQGYSDQAGKIGNISADPLLNSTNGIFCPRAGSPVIYGSVAQEQYMGYIGPCSLLPTPTPPPGTTNTIPPLCGQSNIPPQSGPAPLTVTLFGSGNAGNGAGIDGYRWDFENDGTWDTQVSLDPVTHVYTQPGTYNPKFQVHNVNNIWSNKCNYAYPVVVQNPGTPTVRQFEILFKFDGVDNDAANLAKVTVRFVNPAFGSSIVFMTPPIQATHVNNGIYKLSFGIESNQLPTNSGYSLVLKGEKHLGVRFCKSSQQMYHCTGMDSGDITFPLNPSQTISLDFTGIPLPAGDTFLQDGVVNSVDYNRIKSLLAKPCDSLTDAEKLVGDLDYSGCVNIRDAFLIRKTLETRYDEN